MASLHPHFVPVPVLVPGSLALGLAEPLVHGQQFVEEPFRLLFQSFCSNELSVCDLDFVVTDGPGCISRVPPCRSVSTSTMAPVGSPMNPRAGLPESPGGSAAWSSVMVTGIQT